VTGTSVPGAAVATVEVFLLEFPLSPPAGVSVGYATSHDYVLVRLRDADGRSGWGETYALPGTAATVLALAELLLGADPGRLRDHRRTLVATAASAYARSAVLIAIDDLRARQAELPLHRLYGGPTRDSVPAYAASQGYVQGVPFEETWQQEAASYVAAGYRAIKLRIGRHPVDEEVAALRRVRELVGDDMTLLFDGNGGYSLDQAVRMGRALFELGAGWFEEPLPQRDYRRYPQLARKLDVALAGGEIVESPAEALRLLEDGAVHVLQPEPVICGGLEGAVRIADLAATYQVPVVPHTSGAAIGIATAVQLLACLDDPTGSPSGPPLMLELGQGPNPWRTDLLTVPIEPGPDGLVAVPTGPGLGVEVDEELVRSRASHHATAS